MKRSKFTEEQVDYALRQAESGTPVGDVGTAVNGTFCSSGRLSL